MKLELKHLTPYLPYGLKAEMINYKKDYVGKQYDKIIGIHGWSKNKDWCCLTDGGSKPSLNDIKPILRPLSDLTNDIEVNGEKFVPIVNLNTQGYNMDFDDEFTFEDFIKSNILNNSYGFIDSLIKWHFDVFGLIENGLAIDINTLESE